NAWKQIAGLFRAASRTEEAALPLLSAPAPVRGLQPRQSAEPEVLLVAQHLVFRYQEQAEPVLHGCALSIHRGEHLLLEGLPGGAPGADAGRHHADRWRDGLATLPWGAEPAVHCPGADPTSGPPGAGRELRRARSRDPAPLLPVRIGPGPQPSGHRPSVRSHI